MTHFAMPISALMSAPVVTIPATASLAEAQQILRERGISCLAVTSADRAVGVLSRTDLLRVGRYESRARARHDGERPPTPRGPAGAAALITFPEGRTVGDVMRPEIIALPPGAAVSSAARTLRDRRIHRVFVMDGDALTGVFSTKDVMLAIRDARITTPIAEAMSAPVFTIPLTAPLSLAADRLDRAHVSGLCVIDEGEWPVGMITQNEVLAARDLPADTPVEEVMSYAMLCLDVRTPLYRAAGYAHATRARRVLAVEDRRVVGVMTGLDFARVASAA